MKVLSGLRDISDIKNEYYWYSNINKKKQNQDLLLLELSRDVGWFNEKRVPVCLPNQDRKLDDVTGHMTYEHGNVGGFRVISNNDCNSFSYNNYFFTTVRDHMFCAVRKKKGKKICKDDIGRPMVVEKAGGRYELIGVVSNMVMNCGETMYPAIFTRSG